MNYRQYIPLVILFILCNIWMCLSAKYYSYVTCGSVIKLLNSNYKVRLHSHDVKYGSGSGQQSVTGTDTQEDVNSYWTVRSKTERQCVRGEPFECGSVVRLQHMSTKKNLHSHHFSSPLSGNQEVSAFGDKNGDGDTGDNWTLVCSGDFWEREKDFRLKHVDTEMWLSISGHQYGRPIHGQMEIVGSSHPDSASYWRTVEGVYMKPSEGQSNHKSDVDHDEL
ncbi:stromal cell-derived factor 2-like [Oppia nitens]|uniref:stromal cell-derived factor 2-like n=1 Tax=Oppia nitens TaxID=1686743 RepID=UPI0023DBA77A|nr:stromal cell-derived factor 2-like [Oppia nitens]